MNGKTSWFVRCLLALVRVGVVLLSLWCLGAIWYLDWVTAAAGRIALMALFTAAVGVPFALSFRCRRWLGASVAVSLGSCLAWNAFYRPERALEWDPPSARNPKVTFSRDGKSFTVENVRDFHYRTATDYDIRYRSETYAFDDLESVDYSITHWNGNELFGHVILSFCFRDGRRLAFSPEARMGRGEKYELLAGLYRKYELLFVFATEEDVLQLRTNHRSYERSLVYLYPVETVPERRQTVLRDLLRRAEATNVHPEYYNVLLHNCHNSISVSAEKVGADFFTGWRGPLNGVSEYRAWKMGILKDVRPGEDFGAYRRRHCVNQYVEHRIDPPNYSQLIRPSFVTPMPSCGIISPTSKR